MADEYGTLNTYPQHAWHGHAEIRGDRQGLTVLRDAITDAIEAGEGERMTCASDGEGYTVHVYRMPDAAGEDYMKVWSGHQPYYEMMEIINSREMADARDENDALVAEVERLREWQQKAIPVLQEAIRTDVFGCDLYCKCWKHDAHRLLNEVHPNQRSNP